INTDIKSKAIGTLEWDAARLCPIDLIGMPVATREAIQSQSSALKGRSSPFVSWVDLLGQPVPEFTRGRDNIVTVTLAPGAAYCLAPTPLPRGLSGEAYRQARHQAAWGLAALSQLVPIEALGTIDWRSLANAIQRTPATFLAAASAGDPANCLARLKPADN